MLRSTEHQCVGLVLIRQPGQLTGRIPDAGGDMDIQPGRCGRGERVGELRAQPGQRIGFPSITGTTAVSSYAMGAGVMYATSSGRPVRRASPVAHASARRLAVDPS